MRFANPRALPPVKKVKNLDGDGYVALDAIITEGGMLWVRLDADVSELPDNEHMIAIHRDGASCSITLTANELKAVSESDEMPGGTAYLNAQVDNTGSHM